MLRVPLTRLLFPYITRVCVFRSSTLNCSCSLGSPQRYSSHAAMDLQTVVSKLEKIAPSTMAEDWDNVGLLVEPSPPHTISHILLTNDLTEAVMDEVKLLGDRGRKVGLIVSYHPPIFRPLKRLTQISSKERVLIKALESRIAVYSPHTSHDCIANGVNDWLISGVGKGSITPLSIKQLDSDSPMTVTIHCLPTTQLCDTIEAGIKTATGFSLATERCKVMDTPGCGAQYRLKIPVTNKLLNLLVPHLSTTLSGYPVTVSEAEKIPVLGAGRLLALETPVPVSTVVSRIKAHLGLQHARLALPDGWEMKERLVDTVAVCAGSGSSVLRGVRADLYVTGEMSHHDVLDANSRGSAVVLCEHSNTERGFLPVFRSMLLRELEDIEILISETDHDPLTIV